MRHLSPFDRRRLLGGSIACAAGLGLSVPVRALAAEMPPTPSQTAGPFYPSSFPADTDADLVHVAGRPEPASGIVTEITGRILDRTGRPLSGARVEIWQCDANGRYHHVRDDRAQPPDDRFQGFGRTMADAAGGYRFLTIRPVAVSRPHASHPFRRCGKRVRSLHHANVCRRRPRK